MAARFAGSGSMRAAAACSLMDRSCQPVRQTGYIVSFASGRLSGFTAWR